MPQSFDPNILTLDDASRLVAIQAVLSVGHEKQAVDVGRSALIGGGVGLGTGLLASALSKRKKKRWLRNAILGSLLGAGVGASGAAGKNWWDQRQAPGVREQPRKYNNGGIETPESVQRRFDAAGTGDKITPETYQDEAGLSPTAESNLAMATDWGMPAAGGAAGAAAGHVADRVHDTRKVRQAVGKYNVEELFGNKPDPAEARNVQNLRDQKTMLAQQEYIRDQQQKRRAALPNRAQRDLDRYSSQSQAERKALRQRVRPNSIVAERLRAGTSAMPGHLAPRTGVGRYTPRLGGIGGKIGGGLMGAGVGLLGNYMFGRDLTNAYRNAGTALSSGVN